jgi:hypothetical protein
MGLQQQQQQYAEYASAHGDSTDGGGCLLCHQQQWEQQQKLHYGRLAIHIKLGWVELPLQTNSQLKTMNCKHVT